MAMNTKKGSELLSYIINVDPVLREEIDLPVQGESIKPIGKIIVDNERYKNAFLNAINLIAVTLVKQNDWDNPWEEFTEQGKIDFGQSVREMIVDLVEAHDYNEYRTNATHFLQTEVPDVYEYIHDINFQKFYKVTVNDTQIAMAFNTEDGLYNLIQSIYSRLYESYKYDKYQVDKYQLIQRLLDGTIPSVTITNYANLDTRGIVAFMKGISNKLTFRSPNYNPAGLRLATKFENQRTILNTMFDGKVTTEVLATSYFRNDAEMKTKLALIDGFDDIDSARLSALLGDQYVALTDGDKTKLATIVSVIVADDFFMDYYYSLDNRGEETGATKTTEFYNPESLDNTLWLHAWRVFSTSPFTQCVCLTTGANDVSAVDVTPATATVTIGQSLQFKAEVTTSGIANKSVQWTVDSVASQYGITINESGEMKVPSDYVKGTAGVYTLAISTALATNEFITVDGIKYTAAAADDSATKQATALETLLKANTTFAGKYTVTRTTSTLTFTENAGHYGVGIPTVDDTNLVTGVVAEATTTAGAEGGASSVTVTATSIYKPSVSDTATVTIA